MVVLSVHGILIIDERIYMLRRFCTGYYDNYYTLPGGHVEKNESITDALLRELNEEIGISFRNNDSRLIATTERFEGGKHRLDFYFEIVNWKGKPFNKEPNKSSSANWFTFSKLPSEIVPHIKKIFQYQGIGNVKLTAKEDKIRVYNYYSF